MLGAGFCVLARGVSEGGVPPQRGASRAKSSLVHGGLLTTARLAATVGADAELDKLRHYIRLKGLRLDCGYRLDLLVSDRVVVEVKAVESLLPVHEAQLLTYLKLGGWTVG